MRGPTAYQRRQRNKRSGGLVFYHGTCRELLPDVRRYGLAPANPGQAYSMFYGVYLASSYDRAMYWASMKSRFQPDWTRYGGEMITSCSPVVLKVCIPKSKVSFLEPDYVSITSNITDEMGIEMYSNEWQGYIQGFTWRDSMERLGDVVYPNDIPPEWIEFPKQANARSKTFYHVTCYKNASRVVRRGLEPRVPRDKRDVRGIYLFSSYEDMENALMNWLGDRFSCDKIAVLSIDGRGVWRTRPGVEYEVIAIDPIKPRYIRLVDVFELPP